MKIVGINCGNTGSTGIITKSISQKAKQSNIDYTVAYPDCKGIKKQDGDIVIGNYFIKKIIRRIGIYTGYLDCFSVASTKRLITQMRINNNPPNIINLHNLHSGYMSFTILFRYIKAQYSCRVDSSRLLVFYRQMPVFYHDKMRQVENRML